MRTDNVGRATAMLIERPQKGTRLAGFTYATSLLAWS